MTRFLYAGFYRTQERALSIAYKDYGNDFGFLLEKTFMKDIFMERNISYNLRRGNDAQLPKVRITSFGIERIAYLGNKLWQLLPLEIKQSNTLPIFKK